MLYTDLHTHGISGRDSRSADPETYLRMAEAMLAHGTGQFLPTLFPGPVPVMRAQMDAVKRAMEVQGRDGLGGSARLLGVHLEGPFVNPAKCGALDRDEFITPTLDNLSRLTYGFADVIRIITVAPELPGAIEVIEAATELGIRVNMGHSAATFDDARDGRHAGATGVTHLFNAMSGLHHREPGLAGYALTDDTLYVEIIADMFHVHPAALRLVLACKPAERVILVSDSLAGAKTPGVPEMGPLYMPDGLTLAGSGISLADAVANIGSLVIPGLDPGALASANPTRYIGMCA
ncbi:MAG: amidohydrolase family protein [Nitrospirae bacterium]|nr:amidohydrolase family protein [Nitrospirota bacterium]MBI5696524.1 amidohydrolase family protein [Nitrospirota bacterium]